MSYGRNPHYIYSDGDNLRFEPYTEVPEYLINAFLYKILLKGRRDELKERLNEGKQQWMIKHDFNYKNMTLDEVPQDEEYVEWMNDQEDDLIKELMK